jgi:uncharacterized protein (DUF427 family)
MSSQPSSSRIRIEPGPKRVRAYLGGEVVADTLEPRLVWEVPYYPAYYLPSGDVSQQLLVPSEHSRHSPRLGDARYFTVKTARAEAPDGAWHYPASPVVELRDLIRLDWNAMDHWFEEDEEVFTHPRSPYTRVDILASSRHVEIQIEGVTVADSDQPRLLFETGLPTRYYVPLVDVRMELLRASTTITHCPYKGEASYWSVDTGSTVADDVAWTYRTPLPESTKVAGLVAFLNERVDIMVDGVRLPRPKTPFS